MNRINRTLTAGVLVLAGAAAAAEQQPVEQPVLLRVELQEGRPRYIPSNPPDGRVVALRIRTEDGGMGTCGPTAGIEFRTIGQAVASSTMPVEFEIEGLDCRLIVVHEGGQWMIRLRGGRVSAPAPEAAPEAPEHRAGGG